jgi:hypothetical protein
VTVRTNSDTLAYPNDGSLSFGGEVVVESNGEAIALPWAVVRGHTLSIEWQGTDNVLALLGPVGGRSDYVANSGNQRFHSLLPPGAYDLTLVALPTDGGPVAFVARENIALNADLVVTASRDSAPYTLSFSALDENGQPLPPALEPLSGCSRARAIILPGADSPVIELLNGESPALRTSAFGGQISIVAADLCIDDPLRRIYNVSFDPVHGVSSSMVLTAGGDDLISFPVELRVPAAGPAGASIRLEAPFRLEGVPLPVTLERTIPWSADRWDGTLLLGSHDAGGLELPFRLSAVESEGSPEARVSSRLIRRSGDRVTCFDSATAAPTAYETRRGEPVVLGRGSVTPVVTVFAGERPGATVEFIGQLDESVSSSSESISLFARTGTQLATGRNSVEIPNFATKPSLVARSGPYVVNGLPATSSATLSTGATTLDPLPPTLTSMILVDAAGVRIVDLATRGSAPRVRFSTFDASDETPSANVRFRRNGSVAWTESPAVIVGRDAPVEGLGHAPRGVVYEASLEALATAEGVYDLEIVVQDAAGNSNATLLEPAIAVADGRRRPARP